MQVVNDFKTSVQKAFDEIDPNWRNYHGLVVCGTHSPGDIEPIIEDIKHAREHNIPFLGICFGMQLAAIEYARNVLGMEGATTEEIHPGDLNAVVLKLPDLHVGIDYSHYWLGAGEESYWHNYHVSNGLDFKDFNVFHGNDGLMQAIQHKYHTHFAATQFHPEYQSRPGKPHPILENFLGISAWESRK